MKEAFAKAGIYPNIFPGDVWRASDSAIKLPGSLFRRFHETRYCVVLSNNTICADPDCPVISVAPCSGDTTLLSPADMFLKSTDKNGLVKNSRVMMGHIQPIAKTDLIEKLGEISIDQWESVLKQIFWNFSRE